MTRRARRVDSNQPQVTAELRRLGFSVAHSHTLGQGFPDLVLGLEGHTFLVELKLKRKWSLTEDEIRWAQGWHGHYLVAHSTNEIVAALAMWARLADDQRLYGTLLAMIDELGGEQ